MQETEEVEVLIEELWMSVSQDESQEAGELRGQRGNFSAAIRNCHQCLYILQ